jgi:glycosyltransferase involved in cell wall biosynthesis
VKVIFLIGQLGRGGSERQLYLLLTHLDKDLCDCDVVVFNRSPNLVYNDLLEKAGIKIWTVPEDCKSIPQRMRYLYVLFKHLRPDVVHSWTVHDNPYAGLVGWAAGVPARIGSLRCSLGSPGMMELPQVYRYLSVHSIARMVVNWRDGIRTLSEAGYSAERVIYLPNCVETGGEDQAPPPLDLTHLGIHENDRVAGIVGNLWSRKNHLMFVEGMASVLSRFPDARALIVGQPIAEEPELPGKIASAIKEQGLEGKVIMSGFRDDIPALM